MIQNLPRPVSGRILYPVAIALVALLILCNLALIFGFSSESREESGSRSREVTVLVAKILYPNLDTLSEEEQETAVESLHGYVRKAAHFLEFALLGWLTAALATLIRGYFGLSVRVFLTAGAPGGFCLLTAAADETYQIFTNRGASPVDVCIDFCGGLCGILFLHAIVWTVTAVRRRAAQAQKRKEGASP